MSDPEQILEKAILFLKNQETIFGDFHIDINFESVTNPDRKDQPTISGLDNNHPKTISNSNNEFMPKNLRTEEKPKEEIYKLVEACTSLEELRKVCESADILKTDLEDTNLVFGVGNPHADLLLIGEAPGKNEDEQGEPFVGRAGQLLNKILEAINMKREHVYIANILKHRPPKNRDPLPEERQRSLPFLLKQIELIDPKLILCLGRISAQTLLETNEPMKSLRGKFHTFLNKYELTVTYHPAALLRNPKWKRNTWEDVQMLRKRYDELNCKP